MSEAVVSIINKPPVYIKRETEIAVSNMFSLTGPRQHYLVDSAHRILHLEKPDNVVSGISPPPFDQPLRDPCWTGDLTGFPPEVIVMVLLPLFFDLLADRYFREATIVATRNRAVLRKLCSHFIGHDGFSDVEAAAALSKDLFLLFVLWNHLLTCEVDLEGYRHDIIMMDLFQYEQGCETLRGGDFAPWELVEDKNVRCVVRRSDWTDLPFDEDDLVLGHLPRYASDVMWEVGLLSDIKPRSIGVTARLGFPVVGFSLWVGSSETGTFRRVNTGGAYLEKHVAGWAGFFALGRCAFGKDTAWVCFPGGAPETRNYFQTIYQ